MRPTLSYLQGIHCCLKCCRHFYAEILVFWKRPCHPGRLFIAGQWCVCIEQRVQVYGTSLTYVAYFPVPDLLLRRRPGKIMVFMHQAEMISCIWVGEGWNWTKCFESESSTGEWMKLKWDSSLQKGPISIFNWLVGGGGRLIRWTENSTPVFFRDSLTHHELTKSNPQFDINSASFTHYISRVIFSICSFVYQLPFYHLETQDGFQCK